jgi:hypothetical protein
MSAIEKTLFPDSDIVRQGKGRRRDPFGRFDSRDRFDAYERKISRQRETIKYLLSVMNSHADAIRRRDLEIQELKYQLEQRNGIE